MRILEVSEITEQIKEMCIEANHFLSPDMEKAIHSAVQREKSPIGKQVLGQLCENMKIAGEDMIPICQDTGMTVVFVEAGQDVHFQGGSNQRRSQTWIYGRLFEKIRCCRPAYTGKYKR